MPERPPLLQVAGLSSCYGSSQVLFDVSIEVPPRGVVAILGRNGAGKTTLLKTLAGELTPRRGSILFDGEESVRRRPEARVRAGLGHVPQEQAIFGALSVRENLLIGQMADRSGSSRPEEIVALFPRLGERLNQKAGTLSGGERKMLAIGRALLGRPRLLMLDEPAEGVWHGVVEEIAGRLQLLARSIAVLLVEQHIELALRVADYCYVMDRGHIALQGPADDVRGDPNLVRLLAP